MCIDNRKHLNIPANFSYIIRTAGGNLKNNEFHISFAVSVKGINHFALIGHNNCSMRDISTRKEEMIVGLVRAGWEKHKAESHINQFADSFEIGNEIDFLLSETKRIRQMYPRLVVAPMFYKLEDNRLYLVAE